MVEVEVTDDMAEAGASLVKEINKEKDEKKRKELFIANVGAFCKLIKIPKPDKINALQIIIVELNKKDLTDCDETPRYIG